MLAKTLNPEPRDGIVLFDRENKMSLVNLLPQAVAHSLEQAMLDRPELFDVDEGDLYDLLKADGKPPNPTDNRMRLKLWDAYDKAHATLKPISIADICYGVCTTDLFYKYMAQPTRAAWMVCPPASYVIKMEEALSFATEQMRKVLAMPIETVDKKGRTITNMKLVEMKLKIWHMLEIRVNGATPQRIENKNLNINVDATQSQANEALQGKSMELLDARIRELQAIDRRAQNLPPMKEEQVAIETTATHTESSDES